MEKIARAKELARDLKDVSPWELALIERRIEEWAMGDEFAKGYVFRFAYTQRPHNAPIIDAIRRLIEG